MDGEPFDVYLPVMAAGDIVELSDTEDTDVGLGEASLEFLQREFPDVDPEIWQQTQVTFVAGSATDDAGNPATQAMIVPVDPNRLPAPLPPGSDPGLVISIQAGNENGFNREAGGGATNFDVPAPVTFPNLEGLEPGEKSLIWTFNHDAGDWEIIGNGTVSEDGKSIVSDEGVGILAPGWHFTNPGSPTNGPEDPPCLDTGEIIETVIDAGQAAANCAQDFFEVRKSIQNIFTVASEIRSLISSSDKILEDIDSGKLNTASGVANALAGINSAKTAVVNIVDLFNTTANPISRALKISRCVGQVIGFAENLCNRLNTPNSPCSGPVTNLICVGLAAASSTLDKVNNLIAQAEAGFKRLGLAVLCGSIDQIASIIGSVQPQNSLRALSSPSNINQVFADANSDDETIPQEVIDLLRQLIDQGKNSLVEFNSVEELATSLQDLDTDSENLKDGIAQVRAEFETAPANAPFLVQYDNFEIRGVTNGSGKIDLVLPANTEYTITIYDRATNSLGEVSGVSAPSGTNTKIPTFLMFPVDANLTDTDGEGLVDKVEAVLGTDITKPDTDNDGINDLAEIEQGLDPLGGQGFPTGIISSLPLQGQANAITVTGSTTDTQTQTAYVATGSYGLAIVDASQFDSPIILGQLDLLGDATDIAVDTNLQIAAVATNNGGLQLVDVSDPMLPTLSQTVNISANKVEVVDGIAYATVGTNLKAIDLLTGDELQELTLPGSGTVTDLAREGNQLYAYTSGSDTFSVVDITNPTTATVQGEVNVSVASSTVGISVGNRVAYLGGSGLRTVDISDPSNPTLIGDAEQFFTARDVTLNGSGLALVAAEGQGLGIYNVSDPADTDNFITQIDTPGFTNDIAIASGIAFVADGSSGLQVINYLSFDNQGQAPTVTITSSGTDLDADVEGIQVLEGSSVPIQANVEDDVQVRNVELLVNGEVVSNDVSFPFDLTATALNSDPEATTVDVQVRATDTGGNSTLSNNLTFNLVPDTFAPNVTSTSPKADGRRKNISGISVRFDEPIDTELLDLSGITLTNLGADEAVGGDDDTTVTLQGFQTSETGRSLFVLPPADLTPGKYQLKIDSSIITDRAGNALTEDFTLDFTKRPLVTSLTLGETITGSIVEAGEEEVYTFEGTAGQRLYYDGISGHFQIDTRLISPNGEQVLFNRNTADNLQPFTLLETGTYELIVDASSNITGDYSFQLLDTASAIDLTLDSTISGSLDSGQQTVFYKFEGTAEQQLSFEDLGSERFAGSYVLYGPGNQFITSRSLGFDFQATLPGDGIYFLAVQTNNNEEVNYSFRVS